MPTQKQACQVRQYSVTADALPISCPPRDERLWDAHPRVYLALDEHHQAVCPYCGTVFTLTDGPLASGASAK